MARDRQAAQPSAVEVSVIVPTFLGDDRIPECLRSLVQQDLDPARYEIVVVQNGPEGETKDIVRGLAAAHPRHQFRYLDMRAPGAGRARNVGLAAARGTYFTCVDDDDQVGPSFLSAMLVAARPDVLPVTLVGDVRDEDPGAISFDNYYSRALTRDARSLDLVNAALSLNAAKLAPTDLARTIGYDESLRSGEDVAFWFAYYARYPFQVAPITDPDAAYIRTVRARSVGRQVNGFDFAVEQRLDCIAALRAVPGLSPRAVKVGNRLIQSQARWINRYLRKHPEDHGRMVAAAHQRGLYWLPWRVINDGLGRDLALLYCFTPDLDTSGLVAARRLLERGTVTDVISHDLSAIRATDPRSRLIAGPVVDRAHVVEGRPSFVNWGGITTFVEESLQQVAAWEADKGPYRSVYSRAMAISSHFAAAALKLRRPDIVWTAEMSDPLLVNMDGTEREGVMEDGWLSRELRAGLAAHGFAQPDSTVNVFAWAELITYALADEIVFTNDLQRKMMLDYCADPALATRAWRVSRAEPHPTLPAPYYSLVESSMELDEDCLNLAYFGVFYPTRGLGEVSAALAGLTAAERSRLCLHVFTPDPEKVELAVLRARLADVVKVHGYAPYLEFLNLASRFDVLIVNDAATSSSHAINPYLPSKVSDYLGSGTPVWALYEPGSVLSTMGWEYQTRVGDSVGAQRELRRMLAELGREPAL